MNQPRTTRRPVTQRRHFALHPLSLALMLGFTGTAGALPNAGTVVSGQVTIQNPSANLQVVTQASQRGIVDWKSFSIGSGQTVRFNQPSSSAVLLNRVTGYDPSQILGQMQANGRIFLLNPHGIVFGASARVDVGGLVASTLSLSNADFNAGRYQLTSAGGRGALRNDGVITADGGTVALVAPKVTNAGTIEADGGRVGLAAADSVLVDVEGDGLVFFNASATGMKNRLEHLGRIQADGGTVQMRAAARAAMVDTVLNLSGVVQARSLGMREGQVVIDGGARGITAVHGTIDASGRDAGESGGTVKVLGQMVGLFGNTSIDAAGAAGGGTVLVGGNYQGQGSERNALRTFVSGGTEIDVSATATGDGGTAVVWSDEVTRYHGKISARGGQAGGDGGLIEVSGKQTLVFRGAADLSAPRGKGGTLLLDPQDIILVADSVAGAETDLVGATNDDTILTTYAFDEDTGENITLRASSLNGIGGASTIVLQAERDVIFNTGITFSTANKGLTIQARNDINLGANSIVTNGGAITLNANSDNVGGGSILGSGILNASATSGAATVGGTITVTTQGTGSISLSQVVSMGRDNATAGAAGGAGGNVSITSGSGGVNIAGSAMTIDGESVVVSIRTAGGVGGATSDGNPGGTGGKGGNVVINGGSGPVTIGGAILAIGGVGGEASTDDGGLGGAGGTIGITAAGNVSVAGAIEARGGRGGDGGPGGSEAKGGGGAAAAITVTSTAGSVSVDDVSARGGLPAASGNQNGPGEGAGANITLSADTDLTVTGQVTSSTIGAGNRTVRFEFGQGDAGTNLFTLGGAAIDADIIQAVGGTGTDTLSVARNTNITLAAASLSYTDQGLGGGVPISLPDASIETVALRGGNSNNNIDVSAWTRQVVITMSLGEDTVDGTDAAPSGGARTTLVGVTGSATTFTIDGDNAGTATVGAAATTFTNVGRFAGSAVGGNSFVILDGGAILGGGSITGSVIGNDTLDASDQPGAVAIVLGDPTSAITGLVPAFSQIGTVVGNGAQTTLTGLGTGQTFTIDAQNAGNVDGLNFSGVANLVGGAGNDEFNLTTDGLNSGSIASINGGGGTNTLSYAGYTAGPVTYNVNSRVGTGVTSPVVGVGVLVGNGSDTTLESNATGAVFTLTAGTDAGSVTAAVPLTFTQVNKLSGGTGSDSFVGTGGRLTGTISDAGGTTTLDGTIDTDGAQSYTGPVELAANTTLISGVTGNIAAVSFSSTVNGLFSLEVQTAGITSFGNNVGGVDALTTLTTDAGGTTVLPGTVRTSSHQRFNDAASGTTVTLEITGAGDITLGAGSDLGTLNVSVVGASTVVVNDANDLAIGSFSIGGGSATIDVAQSVSRGATPLTLGGATLVLRVGGGDDVVSAVDTTVVDVFAASAASSVQVSSGGADGIHDLTLTGLGVLPTLVVTGDLTVTSAASDVTQTGPLFVGGDTSITAIERAVTLGNDGNDFIGAVSIVTRDLGADLGSAADDVFGSGAVTLRDKNAIDLGASTLGSGLFTVIAGTVLTNEVGDITQSGAIRQAAPAVFGNTNATFEARFGGSIAVTDADNDFTSAVILNGAGASVGVRDANELVVDLSAFPNGANTGLTAIAGTSLTLQNAPLAFSTGTGSIDLQALGGPLNLAANTTLTTTSGNISLVSNGTLTVAGVTTVSGDLSFTAIGVTSDVLLGGNISTDGSLTVAAGRDVRIDPAFDPFNILPPLNVRADEGIQISAGSIVLTDITLATTAGPIALTSAGNLSVAGISTVSGNLSFTSTGGSVSLDQTISTAGDLDINTAGNIASGGFPINVGGILTADAGGSINLTGQFGGLGTLTGDLGIAITDISGGLTVVGNITTTGGAVDIAANGGGMLDLGVANIIARDGVDISSTGAITSFDGLLVADSSNIGSVGGIDRSLSVSAGGSLTLGNRTLSGDGVSLTGAGVQGFGAANAKTGTFAVSALGGDIVYVGAVGTLNASSGAVAFSNANNVVVGPITATAGTVSFGSTGLGTVGDVTQTGVIAAASVTGQSTGTVDLGTQLNQIGQLGPFSATGGLTVNDGGTLTLAGNLSAGGALQVTSTGLLNLQNFGATGQGVTLTAQGISSAAGSVINGLGSDVLLDAQGQNLLLDGTVQTGSDSATALTIRDAATVTLGGLSTGTAGTTTIGVGTDITGNVTLGGTALLSTGTLAVSTDGAVNLFSTNASNNVATLAGVETTGAFSLRDATGGLIIAGAVDTNGGAVQIVSTGALSMTGAVVGNGVALTGSSVTLQGGDVVGGAGGVTLAATAGNVSQTSGTINTAGALELSATGSVTLNNAVTVGSLGVSTITGDLLLRQNGDLAITGAVQVGGTFTLEAIGGGVDQTAVLTVGSLAVTAAQDVDLTAGANSIGSFSGGSSGGFVHIVDGDLTGLSLAGAVSGTDVELQTSGPLTLGSNNVTATAGAIDLTSVGLTGSGVIAATGGGVTITAGGGDVTLTGGTLAADAGMISILNAGDVALGTVDAGGGVVVLGASGSVSQTGTLTAGSLTGLVTGDVVLGQNNAVGTLGSFSAGSLVLNDLGGLTVTGPVTTTVGGLDLRTTGALVLDGATVVSAGTLVLVGTSLEQTAGSVTAAGTSTLDGGAGGIDLDSDTNSFGDTVTLVRTGGAVNLHASGSLFVGSLDAVDDQPVELVAADNLTLVTGGLLDIGSADLTLEATTGNLVINGDIIANVLDITAGGTISLAGNITTTGDQTYAGAVLFAGSVTMNAGSSKIALQGGATGAGGNLTLISDNTDADAISTGDTIDSIGQFTVDGNITLGGDVLGSGAQLYGGAVVLSAATVTLSAGAGDVTFTSTVDGTAPGAQSLVVTTSGVTRFGGRVGSTVALGDLTTDGGGSTVLAGAGSSGTAFVTTIGDQVYGDALDPEVTSIESDTLLRGNRVTFNGLFNANGFEIAFQTAQETVFAGGVTGGGRIVLSALDVADSIGLAGAAGDLMISQATLTNLAGFGTIVIGAIDFAGDVQSNDIVLPTNLEVRTIGGTVDFNGTVLSDGTARALTVNAGGGTTFAGAVGNAGSGALDTISILGDTVIATASVRSTGAQSYAGNVDVTTATTLAGSAIDIGGTLAAGANNLTLLADAIAVNAVGTVTGTVRLGGSTDATAIGIATADIAGRLDLSQALLNAFGNASQLIIGRTDGIAAITASAFTLAADTRIESVSGNITLSGAITSEGGSNHDLAIATTGLTTLGGVVGAQALGSLTIEGESRLNGGAVTTTGAQNYEGAVVLGAATTLTGGSVLFDGTVDGAFALTVNAGTTSFGSTVGAGTALASLTTNQAGTTTLGGNVSTTGAQTYNDAVALGTNAVLTGSSVTLAGTVNGARTLQIDAAGGVTLGDTVALTSLLVNGPTTIGGTEVSTTGTQRYNGSVTLTGGATTLVGSALSFSSTVNGATDLVLQSNGTTAFGGNVGGTTALRSIDSQGDGDIVLLGDSIRTTGAQSYAGALQVDGNTTLTGGTLLFASGLSGAANLTLRTDALAAQAPITGTGVLTIAPLSQSTTIGLAGGAGDLQITQAILNGADDFSRLVIGRSDGTGAINAGNLRLLDDTRILSRTGDIRLNGSVDGAVNLQLDTGGITRIAGPVGAQETLLSLTTDNNPNVADGIDGEHTLFDAGGGRAVVTTEGNQTYNDPVVTTVPVTLSAANVVAAQTGNRFGAALNLNAQTVTLRSGESIDLGDVTLTNGGTVETGGVLRLSGALRLEGGTLVLTSLAPLTALDAFTDEELAEKARLNGLVVNGKPVVEASAAIDQDATASTVSTASGSLLVLRASGGGSINMLGDNALLGEVSAVSGRLGDTDAARFQGAGAVTIGFVRLNSTEINVAGAPPTDGDQSLQRAGIESDAVWLRADKLFTGPEGLIRARLPFNNFLDGSARSVPGITLFMSEVALAEGGGFGSSASDTWIQVSIGDAAGGFLTVRPKGENGPNAFILLAGDVDARPFYDGAGQITEVRVFYNGDTPRTAQEQGALSAVQALAEDARQSRFEEAVRTENVRQRLRSGVIAEVGAGRPATVGRESIKLPENCEPKAKSLECQ